MKTLKTSFRKRSASAERAARLRWGAEQVGALKKGLQVMSDTLSLQHNCAFHILAVKIILF